MLNKEIINVQDKLYLVENKIADHKDIDPKWIKYKKGYDKVFKANGFYYFVMEIQDIEPFEDNQLSLEFPEENVIL
jgi:hypothetical protein